MINKNIKKILKNNEIKKISNINESLRALILTKNLL